MDGPNVNWDVLKLMSTHQEEEEHLGIINIGSCSLHIIHGALKIGINLQNWELAKTFHVKHNLFKESSVRVDGLFVNLIFSLCHKSNICLKKSCSSYYCSIRN